MSFPAYEENVAKRAALGKNLRSIFDEAGPDVDLSKVKSIPGGPAAVLAEMQRLNAELDVLVVEFKTKLEPLYKASQAALENPELVEGEGSPQLQRPVKSLGQLFVESEAYKGYNGGGNGPSAMIDFDIRNTLMTTDAGWDPESLRIDRVELFATRPAPHVVDFIPKLPTNSALIKYMEETTFTNNAAERAEGAVYGEAALVLTEESEEVESVGVWLPITDEQLEDVDTAQAYVSSRLGLMIDQRLDLQVLAGNGTSPNLEGTDAVVGINTQALGADTIPDAIYKAIVLVESVGFANPSVVFVLPADWQTVRLAKTADGQYIWGHPSTPGPEQIWGVPAVKTTALPADHIILGDYANYSHLYVKRGIQMKITDSHASDFINGKQAIRASIRVAMVHYRPLAFAQVTGV